MIPKWLTLLFFAFTLIEYAMLMHDRTCMKTTIKKEPCHNGTKNIHITTYVRENGICTPFPTTTSVHCDTEKKHLCKCSAVGDPHYITYDGQPIHFYGDCKYTLTKYKKHNDRCSFNIEVQNEYRGDNKYFTYTKSVTIHMFDKSFELGQHRKLKVNGAQSPVPYEDGIDVRIFHSHQFLQFVAPQCSVRVAFDGNSNAFVEVSKAYSNKMKGICGDCNGKRDDLRTKFGEDVSHKKNKFSLIGNSYNVSSGDHVCKPSRDIVYEKVCGKEYLEKLKGHKYCGVILAKDSPFKMCGKKGHVSLKNLFHDCLIDMCVNKNRPSRLHKVRCEILSGLAEVCSEAGFEGIIWRTKLNCPIKCGFNQFFTAKASPCPRTCENHFYGTKSPCYDLPEREGCECKKGFIRDGALCVKPMHCKCLDICVDRESTIKCQNWKKKGQCSEFPEQMNMLCPKTCGNCKSRSRRCQDELSAKKCLKFRKHGLCIHDFYKSLCGLTCNYHKCGCQKEKTIVGKCNKRTNILVITHYKYARDSVGRCAKIISHEHKPCDCFGSVIHRGHCNHCTGIRKITKYIKELVHKKCVHRIKHYKEKCKRCIANPRKTHRCISNRLLKTIVHFHRLRGCYHCVPDKKVTTKVIKCKDDKKVKLDKKTCLKHTTIIRRNAVNCKCDKDISEKTTMWCCNKRPEILKPVCKHGKIIHRTIKYKFHKERCEPVYKDRIEIPTCGRKFRHVKGICREKKNGKFHCKATDIKEIHEVNSHCKCVVRRKKVRRTCCCKLPNIKTTCNKVLGIRTVTRIAFTLVQIKNHYQCKKEVTKTQTTIKSRIHYYTIKGKCQRNCLRRDRINKTFRDGCQIKTVFYKHHIQLCCCRPLYLTETKCIGGYIVTRKYKRFIRNNKCFKTVISVHKRFIKCPAKHVTVSKCIYPRRKQKETTVYYVKDKCRCHRRRRIRFKECGPCTYKEFRTINSKCNKKTCQITSIVYFQNENCENKSKLCYYTCCCSMFRIKRTFCDHTTGIRYKIIKWLEFNKVLQTCIQKSRRFAIKMSCKKTKVEIRKCNADRKQYYQIITWHGKLSHRTCTCKKIKSVQWKRCQCPPRKHIQKCHGDRFHITNIKYTLNRHINRCIRHTSTKEKIVKCSNHVLKRIKNISKCRYEVIEKFYRVKNCQCKLEKRHQIYFRCCDKKPKTIVRCLHGHQLRTTTINYLVSHNKKKCHSVITRNLRAITCKHYVKVIRTPCKNRIYWIITKTYKVKNCKCVRFKIDKKRKLCGCRAVEKIRKICLGNGFKTIYTTLRWTGEKCVPSVRSTFHPIKCRRAVLKRGKCNRTTGLLTATKTYYVTVKCKCIRKTHRYITACPCFRKDRIERNPCQPNGKRTVEVYRFFLPTRGRCFWKVHKSFIEDCSCPKEVLKKLCVANVLRRIREITHVLRLTHAEILLYKCVKILKEIDRRIKCNRDYQEERCYNNVKIKKICKYRKVACQCQKRCHSVTAGPCQCSKLNKCQIQCIDNVKYSVCLRYEPGSKKCKQSSNALPTSDSCPPQRTECEPKPIHKNDGLYKICIVIYYEYQDCACVEQIISVKDLIHCTKDVKTTTRCVKNQKIVTSIQLKKKGNKCVLVKKEQIVNYVCLRPTFTKQERRCSTKYILTYYKRDKCKCVRKTLVKSNSKCCIKTQLNKTCKNNHWEYIRITHHQKLSRNKLFPGFHVQIFATFCQKVKKHWKRRIICLLPYTIRSCNVNKQQLTIEHHFYIVHNCKCVKKVTIKHTKCHKCPSKKITRSECGKPDDLGRRYFDVIIKTWKPQTNNKCKMTTIRRKEICQCEKTKHFKECKHGKRIYTTIWYNKKSKPVCKPMVEKHKISIPCYNKGNANKWVFVKTTHCRKPGQFTIKHYEKDVFSSKNCTCRKVFKSVKVKICCSRCRTSRTCRRNYLEIRNICHRSVNLRCQKNVSYGRRYIVCPRSSRHVVGNCKGKTIKYRITTYRVWKCRCIRKIRFYIVNKIPDTRKCVGNRWQIKHTKYELKFRVCIAEPPVIKYYGIACIMSIRIVDKKIDKCKFHRYYYSKVVKNCRCTDKLMKSEILHYQCCKKDSITRRCVNHGFMITTRIHYKLLDFKCYPVKKISKTHISCKKHKQKRIQTGKCTYKIIHFTTIKQNCKCLNKIVRTENKENCCTHLKRHRKYLCDAKTGRKIIFDIFYRHTKQDTCLKLKHIRTMFINCHRFLCSRKVGRCVHNERNVKMFCKQRKGCDCVKVKVKDYNECCGKRFQWIKVGECNKHKRCFQRVKYYKLVFSKIKHRCFVRVMNIRYKRCCCPNKFTVTKCVNNNMHLTIENTYLLKPYSCELIKKEYVRPIRRCANPRIMKISEICNKKTGWKTITYKKTYPLNCKCHHKNIIVKKICICHVAFPNPKEKIYCKHDNIIVKERKKSHCKETSVKWTTIRTEIPILHCDKTKKEIGHCFKSTIGFAVQIRYDTTIQFFVKHCNCQRKVIRRHWKHCRCRRSHQAKKCMGSKLVITTYSFVIQHGYCKQIIHKTHRSIRCPHKPIITRSKCVRNKYIVTKKTFSLKRCHCSKFVLSRQCDCKCPRNRKYRKCSKHYLINEITISFVKKHCRCFKHKSVKQITPNCPSNVNQTVGKCIPEKTASYRIIITRKLKKHAKHCKCTIVEFKRRKICGCPLKVIRRVKCVHNHKVFEIWGLKIDWKHNKCVKYLKHSISKPFICKKKSIRTICDKSNMKGKEITLTYHLKNCHCVKHKVVKVVDCHCRRKPVLIEEGKCSGHPLCHRKDKYYREKLLNGKCRRIKFTKTKICCCPRNFVNKRCRHNHFTIINVEYELIKKHRCVKRTTETVKIIKCSHKIIKKVGKCKKNGYQTIHYFRDKIRHCKCVRLQIRQKQCRCRCRKDKIQVSCHPRRRLIKKTTIKYHLSKCKCQKKTHVENKFVACPRDIVLTSNCIPKKGHHYSEITTRKTHYGINNHCKCHAHHSVSSKICHCKKNEKVEIKCDARKHELVTTKSFNILRRGHCITMKQRRTKSVLCNGHWRLKGDSGCKPHRHYGIRILTYSKLVHDKCKCREVTKTKSCHCACSGPRSTNTCIKELIHHKIFKYKIINCKCKMMLVREKISRVQCHRLRSVVGKCHREKNHCVRYIQHHDAYTVNCKCHRRYRIVKSPCFTCPCRSSIKRICARRSNSIITTTVRCEILSNGLIKKHKQIQKQEVPCNTQMHCRPISKCKHRTQWSRCTKGYKENCTCKTRITKIRNPCECKIPTKVKGPCNRKRCIRKITIITSHFIVLTNGKTTCEQNKKTYKEKCCCPKNPKPIVECRQNKLVREITKYHFDNHHKICNSLTDKKDLTPDCRIFFKRHPGKCNRKTCLLHIKSTSSVLVYCKCVIRTKLVVHECCCPRKDYTTVKCTRGLEIIFNHKFIFKNGKCLKYVNKRVHYIRCPRSTIHRLKCNLITRKRIVRQITYKLKHCRCIPKITDREVKCRCQKSKVVRKCLSKKFLIQISYVSYTLIERLNKCIKHIRTITQYIKCIKFQRDHCSFCFLRHHKGLYKRCITTWRRRKGCKCTGQSKINWVLCRCARTTSHLKCRKNNLTLITIYYIKKKSNNIHYNFECFKKERIKVIRQRKCGKSYVKRGSCIHKPYRIYTIHYNIRKNCQCIPQIKVKRVLCRCPRSKIIQTQCIDITITRKTFRKYKLVCNKKLIPDCHCIFVDNTVDEEVKCPDDTFKEKCVHQKLTRTWTTYDVENCVCVPDTQSDSRPSCFETDCKDILSKHQCNRIKNLGKCKRSNVYNQFLCPVTCGHCEKCDKPIVKEYLNDCQCSLIGGRKICSRKLKIVKYVLKHRKCVAETRIVESLCKCHNIYPNKTCKKAMKEGRCRNKNIRKNCAYHCNPKCRRCDSEEQFSICVQSGPHKGKFEVLKLRYIHLSGVCLFERTVTYQGHCMVCDLNPIRIVLKCLGGKRTVITKYVKKLRNGSCVNKERRDVYSCVNCCKESKTKISTCNHGYRVVSVVFWANNRNYCRKHRITNRYHCNKKCSDVKVIHSKCLYNKKLIIKTWYSDNICLPHTFYKVADCCP